MHSSIIAGIIPIFISCTDEYWYIMPIATKIQDYLKDKTIEEIVVGTIQLSETLVELHRRGISHRDIKPSNIYFYDERFSFGDFGLVDFPDNPNEFTQSDRALGAIFTIAPEMKRNPKHADGTKADVFSLAKTLWMFISGDDRGFDGTYDFLDSSHSLRYIEKYRNTHLVELDELLRDATNNDPDKRPTIEEFKLRLSVWVNVFHDEDKAQASDWKFLNKQLFGSSSPGSSTWRNLDGIVEVLNTVGMTPAYNHMLLSDRGGLDSSHAELANEAECIKLYDTSGTCFILKPKCLYYEGFNADYEWNYFLLELDKLNPIFEESELVGYEYLVEDKPAHYVSAEYAQYGVYDYDTGVPLPEGYRVVRRYTRGKFLIVMKRGPYNKISGAYDGRHGLRNNLVFRDHIESLISLYVDIYSKVRKDAMLKDLTEDEIERRILCMDCFNENPFSPYMHNPARLDNMKEKNAENQKSKKHIKNSYREWCFSRILEHDSAFSPKIKFYFKFRIPDNGFSFDSFREPLMYICKDGYIRELSLSSDTECYYVYDREKAISLRDKFQQTINCSLRQRGLLALEEYENCISIDLIKCGKPTHLFTKDEIKEEMQNADDRVHNKLVIDEDGYAKVIEDKGYGYLFPVSHESWDSGNIYVGKYSKLLTLDDDYLSSLQGWLAYLKTGRSQYVDYIHVGRHEEELLQESKEYY